MKYSQEYKKALDPKLVKRATEYLEFPSSRTKEVAYMAPEDFMALPHDKKQVAFLKDVLSPLARSPLRYVFVIGIGGSALGAKAVEKAFARDQDSARRADIIFLEDCDERFLRVLETLVGMLSSPEEFAIVYVSKSGSTLETAANADALFAIFGKRFGGVFARTVVVTDYGSALHRLGDELGATVVPMPKAIGGRFSIFTPAGLVPLHLAGFRIDDLLSGAAEALSLKSSGMQSVLLSAVYAANEAKSGKAARDLFLFVPELEDLGKWWRQLYGESLGKLSPDGADWGAMPTVSIGSHDLHSVAQRYFGGREDFFTTLVSLADRKGDFESGYFTKMLSHVPAHPLSTIEEAVFKACRETFADLGLPFDELTLDEISLSEIGAFMQFKMIETAILGHLAQINTFDQPDVEGYKRKAREILKRDS